MIGYNNQSIKLSPYNALIPLYDNLYALHKTFWGRPCMARYGPPTPVDPRAAELAAGRRPKNNLAPEKLRLAVNRAGKNMRLSRRQISG